MRKIECIVIHHSAGHEGNVTVFAAEHRAKFGTNTVGYHAVITNGKGGPDGLCSPGRPDAEKGVGVFGANTGKLHICLVGQFAPECPSPQYAAPTSKQLRSLGLWLIGKCRQYGVHPDDVKGHKEVAIKGHGTQCPGNLDLKKIRQWLTLWQTGQSNKAGPLDTFLAGKSSGGDVSTPQARPGTNRPVVQVVGGSRPGIRLIECEAKSQGTLWVPLKDLGLALGTPVSWDAEQGVATITIKNQETS